MLTYLDGLGEVFQADQGPFEHVCNVNTLAVTIHHIALCVARHTLIPRCAVIRSVDDLRWLEWIFVGGSKTDDYILETKAPGGDVVSIR